MQSQWDYCPEHFQRSRAPHCIEDDGTYRWDRGPDHRRTGPNLTTVNGSEEFFLLDRKEKDTMIEIGSNGVVAIYKKQSHSKQQIKNNQVTGFYYWKLTKVLR